jgi:2-polyprenyl-3-methyl-5-hydroxy-6-metoxy-1,4-benzoquinol methylase
MAGFDTVFISTSASISESDLKKLAGYCIRIISRENRGYDFFSWKVGLEQYSHYHEHAGLLLANDSVYGPLFDFGDIITRLENIDADIVGMTDSYRYYPHLQSYFLYCKNPVVLSKEFINFFDQVEALQLKNAVIRKYEVGFSKIMGKQFRLAALYSLEDMLDQAVYLERPKSGIDPTVRLWKSLITKFKFPFLKRSLLTKRGVSINEALSVLAQSDSDFDVNMLSGYSIKKPVSIISTTEVIGATESPICYLCGKHGEVLYHALEDKLFGVPGRWGFKRCSDPNCGLVWLDPMPARDEIGKAYRNYYTHNRAKYSLSVLPGRIVRAIFRVPLSLFLQIQNERKRRRCMYLDRLPPGRLLEVGCGSGLRLERMRALGWEVFGQEIDPVAAEQARKKTGIHIHLGPLKEIEAAAGEFDAVIMSHVLEHVHDPVAFLSDCHRLLRDGGKLIVSTPNLESYGHQKLGPLWRGLEPPRHLYLFMSRTLTQATQRAGFSQHQCWTTDVTADNIGRNIRALSSGAGAGDYRTFTMGDELRGMSFQVAAHQAFLKEKSSGEECVIIATK